MRFFSADSVSVTIPGAKLYKLDKGPATTATITKSEALDYYTQMTRIRLMEDHFYKMYHNHHVRGFCQLCSGQVCISIKQYFVYKELPCI